VTPLRRCSDYALAALLGLNYSEARALRRVRVRLRLH
jgi:hypothetical protein